MYTTTRFKHLLSIFTADCQPHPIQMVDVETIWELHTLTIPCTDLLKFMSANACSLKNSILTSDPKWLLFPVHYTHIQLRLLKPVAMWQWKPLTQLWLDTWWCAYNMKSCRLNFCNVWRFGNVAHIIIGVSLFTELDYWTDLFATKRITFMPCN